MIPSNRIVIICKGFRLNMSTTCVGIYYDSRVDSNKYRVIGLDMRKYLCYFI